MYKVEIRLVGVHEENVDHKRMVNMVASDNVVDTNYELVAVLECSFGRRVRSVSLIVYRLDYCWIWWETQELVQ